jgi:threonylcarbamoyladenosine tRNA methylthiotransferase MtaB
VERTAPEVRRIITLSSGHSRGSNLLAIHRYLSDADLPISIRFAIFSSAKAPAIDACEEQGIACKVIPAKDMRFFEQELKILIRSEGICLIALCGFMKLLSVDFIESCGIPILNVHPALLPNYGGQGMYGSKVHEAVFAAGEKRSGATIHLVDPIYDHGRILAQKTVDISACKSAAEIAAKVLEIEHYLYPRAIAALLNVEATSSSLKLQDEASTIASTMVDAASSRIKIAISTLGCKTNFFESASIFEQFKHPHTPALPNPRTPELTDFNSPADIYIINTCTVTNRSDYKSRNLIRKALAQKALNPLAKVVVTGCFAQRSVDEIRALGDIDLIVDNQSKLDIAAILQGQEHQWQDIMDARDFAYRPVSNMLEHTRAFQKIQDGCDFYCSYCAVPYARGHSRSARFADVLAQSRLFADSGFKEIVLGGVNLGLYHDDDKDLADVLIAMGEIEDLRLLRISSIEPQLLYGDLLARLKDIPKLCPHFHIPLQSGSDRILNKMGRRYDTRLIRQLTEDILQAFPDAAIGFDLITGFPSETEELFQETVAFLQELPIAYLHVFSYSRRKGTVADAMPAQVPNPEKTRRAGILSKLSIDKKLAYRDKLLSLNVKLCGVAEPDNELLSDHYLRVRYPKSLEQGSFVCAKAQELEFI